MKIAIASGKGGTGKTLFATNLARVTSRRDEVTLFDLDVEEPNCGLFLLASERARTPVERMRPVVDETKCTHCGMCNDLCEFNAIAAILTKVLVFPELCHGCHGCLELCPEGAIRKGSKEIGNVSVSRSHSLTLVTGELRIGEPAAASLVRETKRWPVGNGGIQIYDSPPGTSCPVIEAVQDADYVVLVAEPTRFGLHDLDRMVCTLRALERPFGVVVNKAMDGNRLIEEYCGEQDVAVLLRIPLRRDIATDNAHGLLVAETIPDIESLFEDLLDKLPTSPEEAQA